MKVESKKKFNDNKKHNGTYICGLQDKPASRNMARAAATPEEGLEGLRVMRPPSLNPGPPHRRHNYSGMTAWKMVLDAAASPTSYPGSLPWV